LEAPLRLIVAPLAALGLLAAPVALAEDLDKLLDSIPTIETKEDEAAKEAAEEAAKEAAADPLAEDSLDVYVQRCRDHVLSYFEVPKSIAKKAPDTTSTVLLKLYGDGTYMAIAQVRPSDEKKFDKAVLKAIQAAAPLPKPPVSLRNVAAKGIRVEFTAR
jgi:outer membrane biosynthesis protein TonB